MTNKPTLADVAKDLNLLNYITPKATLDMMKRLVKSVPREDFFSPPYEERPTEKFTPLDDYMEQSSMGGVIMRPTYGVSYTTALAKTQVADVQSALLMSVPDDELIKTLLNRCRNDNELRVKAAIELLELWGDRDAAE